MVLEDPCWVEQMELGWVEPADQGCQEVEVGSLVDFLELEVSKNQMEANLRLN